MKIPATPRDLDRTMLSGIIPILITPFSANGEIDEASLRREVAWAVACGAHGLGIALASEIPRLSAAEKHRMTSIVVDEVRGRVPLVVHIGSEGSRLSADLASEAAMLGARAVMVPPPTFEVGGRSTVVGFFRDVVSATDLPVVLQDIPNAPVSPDVVRLLAQEFPGRIAVKIETAPSPLAVERMTSETQVLDVPVFGGAGGLHFFSEMLRGAVGSMPGCSLVDLFMDVWNDLQAGEADHALRRFNEFQPLLALITLPQLLIPMHRHLLFMRGIFATAEARQPCLTLSEVDIHELQQLWSTTCERLPSLTSTEGF